MTSFHEGNLVKKLEQVTTTQDSIQTLSLWVLHHKSHCKQIVEQWLACYRKSKSSHQLALFYLANDIVQHSRRKQSLSFLEEFKPALRQAARLTNDAKTVAAISRVLNIWSERAIYPQEFIDELRGPLGRAESRKLALISKIVSDYSLKEVVEGVEALARLEKGTQASAENARNHPTVHSLLNSTTAIDQQFKEKLKDKSNGEQYSQEYEEAAKRCRQAIEAFDAELLARRQLLGVLEKTKIYHGVQYTEAKAVAATFGNCELGIGQVKAKLEATFPHLGSSSGKKTTIADSIPTSTLRSVMNSIQQAQSVSSSRNPAAATTSSLDQRLSMLSNSGTFSGLGGGGGSSSSAESEKNRSTSFHTVYDPKFQPYYNPSMDFSNLYGTSAAHQSGKNSNNSSTENTEPADMDLVNSDDEDGGGKHDRQQSNNKGNGGSSAIETGPMAAGANHNNNNNSFNLMGLPPSYQNLLPPPPPPPLLPPSLKDFFPNGAPPPFPGAVLSQLQPPPPHPTSHIPLPPALMIDHLMAGVQQQQQQLGVGGGPIRSQLRSHHQNSAAPYGLHPPPPPPPPPNNAPSSAPLYSNHSNNNNRNHHHHQQSNSNQGPNNHRGWKGGGGGGNSNNNGNNGNRGSWKQRNSYGNHH